MAGHIVRARAQALRTHSIAARRPHILGGKLVPPTPSYRNIATRRITTVAVAPEPTLDVPGAQVEFPPPQQNRRDAIKQAKPFSEFLTDTFNRQHDYLRISVTERCNLRCLYCMPEEGVPLSPPDHLLTTPEIFYISSLFVDQGVNKIRLTGGEPTVRRDILPLMRSIGSLSAKGLRELAITTNGISLHRKLDSMVESGLTGINLSLDTLDPFQFQVMTRRKGFDAVMRSVDRVLELKRLGAPVKLKINCVIMRGLNDREIVPFVELGREKDIEVRFIEYMPFDGNKWNKNKMMSYQEMLDVIRAKYPSLRPVQGHKNDTSKTWEIPGFVGKIGFITSMTHNFCGTCNRLRITSDGNLKVCLFGNTEVSLRDIMRKDSDGKPIDEEAFEALKEVEMNRQQGLVREGSNPGWSERERELLEVIGAAVKRKKAKHAGMGELENMKNRPMILIGENNPVQSSVTAQHQARTPVRPSVSNLSQPWKSIPMHLLGAGSSSMGIRQFSSSSRKAARREYPFAEEEDLNNQQQQREEKTERPRGINKLTHVNQNGTAHMVSVANKWPTHRTAFAVSSVRFSKPEALQLIKQNAIQKGDVLSVARIAGIMAAKQTANIIPLCHNINITHAEVEAALIEEGGGSKGPAAAAIETLGEENGDEDDVNELDTAADADEVAEDEDGIVLRRSESRARIYSSSRLSPGDSGAVPDPAAYPHGGVLLTARVETVGVTGVEMDALHAANAAALTVFDMCKAVDKAMQIQNSRVVLKSGGKSGDWVDAAWLFARAGVAQKKDLDIIMGWKGGEQDLPDLPDLNLGPRGWKKCFKLLTRAGWDAGRAADLLRWIKPAPGAAAAAATADGGASSEVIGDYDGSEGGKEELGMELEEDLPSERDNEVLFRGQMRKEPLEVLEEYVPKPLVGRQDLEKDLLEEQRRQQKENERMEQRRQEEKMVMRNDKGKTNDVEQLDLEPPQPLVEDGTNNNNNKQERVDGREKKQRKESAKAAKTTTEASATAALTSQTPPHPPPSQPPTPVSEPTSVSQFYATSSSSGPSLGKEMDMLRERNNETINSADDGVSDNSPETPALTASLIRKMDAGDIFADGSEVRGRYDDLLAEMEMMEEEELEEEELEGEQNKANQKVEMELEREGKNQQIEEPDMEEKEEELPEAARSEEGDDWSALGPVTEEPIAIEWQAANDATWETLMIPPAAPAARVPPPSWMYKQAAAIIAAEQQPRHNRFNARGLALPNIKPTPMDVARAQKSTDVGAAIANPSDNPKLFGIKGERLAMRDAMWDKRMEKLLALDRLAQTAVHKPEFSRHWGRAVGQGQDMMRKVRLAALIQKHDSMYDVLEWNPPPGVDGTTKGQRHVLQDSWNEYVKSGGAKKVKGVLEVDLQLGVPPRIKRRHMEADVKARLKRAMGRIDYNEWCLLTAIRGKRERRWLRRAEELGEEERASAKARELMAREAESLGDKWYEDVVDLVVKKEENAFYEGNEDEVGMLAEYEDEMDEDAMKEDVTDRLAKHEDAINEEGMDVDEMDRRYAESASELQMLIDKKDNMTGEQGKRKRKKKKKGEW